MRSFFIVIFVCSLSLISSAKTIKKDRKPAQVGTKQTWCVLNGSGNLNGKMLQLGSPDTIIAIGKNRADIRFTTLVGSTQIESKDTLATSDCEPDKYDTTEIMKVSIPYSGTTSEGWLLCHTTGHGLYNDPKTCDKRPY